MDIGYDQDEDKDEDEAEEMKLDSEPSTPEPPNSTDTSNTDLLINSDGEIEAKENILEDYYDSKIYNNHPYFPMIWEKFKEKLRTLHNNVNIFNKSKLPYSSVNDLFIAKVAGAETRQRNDTDIS